MIKYCKGCGEQIHPKRVEILPKTQTCVNCSGSEKKGAITVMQGEGDHTYVETIILEADEYRRYKEAENNFRNQSTEDSYTHTPPLESLYNESEQEFPNGFHEVNLNDENYEQ